MKNKLILTIECSLVEQANRCEAKHETSLSQLVELYFKGLARTIRKQSILELQKDMPKPKITVEGDLKETYYNQQKNKDGVLSIFRG